MILIYMYLNMRDILPYIIRECDAQLVYAHKNYVK